MQDLHDLLNMAEIGLRIDSATLTSTNLKLFRVRIAEAQQNGTLIRSEVWERYKDIQAVHRR